LERLTKLASTKKQKLAQSFLQNCSTKNLSNKQQTAQSKILLSHQLK
jgi:hypothetical protein